MRLAKKGKKNSNDIVWFYPERALEKTVLLLAYTCLLYTSDAADE